MNRFDFFRPETAAEAQAFFRQNAGAKYLAGGTNLVDLMKKGIERPEALIDLSRLPFSKISLEKDGSLRLGALALNADVADDKAVRAHFPLLSEAILAGASPQLRNMATVGGNLLQRTRCPYFYDQAAPCNKRQNGSGCSMRSGEARSAAIFGASASCCAVHPSDFCVALAALDAEVLVQKMDGSTVVVPFSSFHFLPKNEPQKETVLADGDLILEVVVPKNPFSKNAAYEKIRDRASYAFALVSVAAALDLDEKGRARAARLAFGGVAPKAWRAAEAELFLVGKKAETNLFEAAADLAAKNADPLEGNFFKVKMLRNAVVSALKKAVSRK